MNARFLRNMEVYISTRAGGHGNCFTPWRRILSFDMDYRSEHAMIYCTFMELRAGPTGYLNSLPLKNPQDQLSNEIEKQYIYFQKNYFELYFKVYNSNTNYIEVPRVMIYQELYYAYIPLRIEVLQYIYILGAFLTSRPLHLI